MFSFNSKKEIQNAIIKGVRLVPYQTYILWDLTLHKLLGNVH